MPAPHLAHIVFFTLHESSPANRAALVAACDKYLSGHEGTVYYSAGILNDELARPVNDRGFDVALHVVFESKAAHDVYQQHPRHIQFVEENKPNWKQVRVFDSDIG
jgi:heme-degrading monooxygenase HmoA